MRQQSENVMKPNTVGRTAGQIPQIPPYTHLMSEAGFLRGTILLTQRGEMRVNDIVDGDKIITRDQGFVQVCHVSRSMQKTRAISFAAGSLGDTRPDQDLLLPAGQRVLIRDWRAQAMFGQKQAMVRADALVDGEFIRDLGQQNMELYQLHFEAPHVLYAGGLELASHLTEAALSRAA